MISSEIYYKNLQKKYSRRINLDRKRILKVLEKLKFPHLNLKIQLMLLVQMESSLQVLI